MAFCQREALGKSLMEKVREQTIFWLQSLLVSLKPQGTFLLQPGAALGLQLQPHSGHQEPSTD
jgi:hypothetical protein